MVDIKVERRCDFEAKSAGEPVAAIATKKSTWVNGAGKTVVQTISEHDISLDEAKNVVNKLVPEELEKVDKEIEKINKDIPDIKKEIKDVVNTREYAMFKRKLESEEYKKFFETLNREKALKAGEKRIEELHKAKEDILDWKNQMQQIVDFFAPKPENTESE